MLRYIPHIVSFITGAGKDESPWTFITKTTTLGTFVTSLAILLRPREEIADS